LESFVASRSTASAESRSRDIDATGIFTLLMEYSRQNVGQKTETDSEHKRRAPYLVDLSLIR